MLSEKWLQHCLARYFKTSERDILNPRFHWSEHRKGSWLSEMVPPPLGKVLVVETG